MRHFGTKVLASAPNRLPPDPVVLAVVVAGGFLALNLRQLAPVGLPEGERVGWSAR